jgi:invasion protein IalB
MILTLSSRLRMALTAAGLALAVTLTAAPNAQAETDKAKAAHGKNAKSADKTDSAKGDQKSAQIGSFGDWGAYQTQGKSKTCYALAQPKTREPSSLKRETAYVFISYRPAENVKNEISVIMGFPMKDGADAQALVGDAEFSLIAKGSNAWVKNPAEEGRLIDAMKKSSKLVVKATSSKGKASTDTYSLSGLQQALDKVRKECQ